MESFDTGSLDDEEDASPLTDEELEAAFAGDSWCPKSEAFSDFLDVTGETRKQIDLPPLLPSQFAAFAFQMPRSDGEGYSSFSFDGRRHMYKLYDTPAKRILLCCGRQVEKTVVLCTQILLPDGSTKSAGDVSVGDQLATLDVPNGGHRMAEGGVTWVSRRYTKPCVRITTRQGHEVTVATTHPMRVWDGWREAGAITVGTRLAAVRRAGTFFEEYQWDERVRLTAYMLGDGCMATRGMSFTSLPGAKLDEFLGDIARVGVAGKLYAKKGTAAVAVHLSVKSALMDWFVEDQLIGTKSATKFIPAWVFRLPKDQTALFLNRLWSTDGHVKQNGETKYSIEYCSISRKMILQIQSLLWKFGIPSRIRKNWPNIYKKRGEVKYAYILRVETREGLTAFLSEIGALGKSERVALPAGPEESNNRDTYPIEINELLRQILESNRLPHRGNQANPDSLRSAGLRETLKYPPTAGKLAEYVTFFRKDVRYSPVLVDLLEAHGTTDLYWDEVVSVEDVGDQECIDFEVKDTHNFVADGLITHNSTLIGNELITYSCMIPGHKSLYVSPSSTQTKTFSNDRIKDPIETSPVLRSYTTRMLSQNVFEKQFVNRAKITLRYAFLNADRVRGVSPWLLAIDEIQDILSDTIPVIEQATSHAPEKFRRFFYAGTPKGLDNPIEYYWSASDKSGRPMSTQNEWAVPCEGCNFWNILGEKNIGRKSLICEKCGKQIYPQHPRAQWTRGNEYGVFEGYRIPQLMVPWRPWEDILLDYSRYSRDKFYNEVLGLSFDSGIRPVSRTQIRANCVPELTMHPDKLELFRKGLAGREVFAGIDWGTDGSAATVITLGTYVGSKFRIFWIHRFEGEDADPDVQLKKIVQILRAFGVTVIGADYGAGHMQNNTLVREFGRRLQRFQYVARVRKKVHFEPLLKRFIVHRTEVMSDVFSAIKRGNVFEFPRWEEFHIPYAQEIMNIFTQYNEKLRMIQYQHRPDRPDDSFHSITYCFLASMIKHPRPDIITPSRELSSVGSLHGRSVGPVDQG